MRGILHFYKSFFGELTAFMVFSFFVSGCHTGDEPASVIQIPVKKEETNRNQAKAIQSGTIVKTRKKIPETPVNNSVSGILLSVKQENKSRIYDSSPDVKNTDAAIRRDPFALPAALRKQQPVAQEKQSFPLGNSHPEAPLKRTSIQQTTVPPSSQEPCVAGIFEKGKEKLALLHWQQIQGIFHRGEPLGNGYYVKDITAEAVSLYPEKNGPGIKPFTLTLQKY